MNILLIYVTLYVLHFNNDGLATFQTFIIQLLTVAKKTQLDFGSKFFNIWQFVVIW